MGSVAETLKKEIGKSLASYRAKALPTLAAGASEREGCGICECINALWCLLCKLDSTHKEAPSTIQNPFGLADGLFTFRIEKGRKQSWIVRAKPSKEAASVLLSSTGLSECCPSQRLHSTSRHVEFDGKSCAAFVSGEAPCGFLAKQACHWSAA